MPAPAVEIVIAPVDVTLELSAMLPAETKFSAPLTSELEADSAPVPVLFIKTEPDVLVSNVKLLVEIVSGAAAETPIFEVVANSVSTSIVGAVNVLPAVSVILPTPENAEYNDTRAPVPRVIELVSVIAVPGSTDKLPLVLVIAPSVAAPVDGNMLKLFTPKLVVVPVPT